MSVSQGNTRLVDYFVISGLDVNSGLEPDQLSGDKLTSPPLERPYKSKVLAHYPDHVPWNAFDAVAVGMLCHPQGLCFRNQRDKKDTKFHTFIITKEDGTRTYGASLTFFEEVHSKQICLAMQTLQSMHKAELSNAQSRALYSHLGPVYKRSPKVPRSKMDQVREYDFRRDTLYVTKCISVISTVPLNTAFRMFLMALHEAAFRNDNPELPLESYIYNTLFEVPLPPPGRSMKFFMPGDKPVVCQRPGNGELPLLDYSLRELLELLGVDNVLSVLSCVLLEHQVLLYSQEFYRLMLVAESLSALIFPFTWQHVYVPILPASLLHFLDAPVPYIMGLHLSTNGHTVTEHCRQGHVCFVDIDSGVVELPDDLPTFPYRPKLLQDINLELSRLVTDDQPGINNGNQPTGMICSESRDSFRSVRLSMESMENDSGMSSTEGSASSSLTSIPNKVEILQHSEALAKITALAKRTGVIKSLEDISDAWAMESNKRTKQKVKPTEEVKELLFNNSIREIFLHYFMLIFSGYEAFVIQPSQDMESWLTNRETVHNFDKASFLGDQPEAHLPFLAAFLESQMFTSFIDNKIISQWEDADPFIKVFDGRLKSFKDLLGDHKDLRYHRSDLIREIENMMEKRARMVDFEAPRPHQLEGMVVKLGPRSQQAGLFPELQAHLLEKEPTQSLKNKKDNAKWRRKDRIFQHSQHLKLNTDQREKYIAEARSKSVRQPKLSDMNQADMNWQFVETLLKECKTKTKRMLVEKMGQEAIELGHGDCTITGVEENTLIASLCDLLERIFSHGLQCKRGRSALWSHLLAYQKAEGQRQDRRRPSDTNKLAPDLSTAGKEPDTGSLKRHRRKTSRGPELPELKPLPVSVTQDMRNVQNMTDIKTEVGYARAWVRLSLEKKMLSTHMKELLADTELLRKMYKRYAFLRCEDEREQFICHLLSLNAVDYNCFTNTFTNTVIPYRMLLFPSKKFSGGTTTANCWLCLAGQLGDTGIAPIPKHNMDFFIEHKNLGILTTLRLGHDNAGISPKWMVEHMLVRNEVTGLTYRFPCGRWLGKGIDDGSTERLLVAEVVPPSTDSSDLMVTCRTPPRCRSPSMPRRASEPILFSFGRRQSRQGLRVSDIQEMLGDAVNNLVKHYFKPEKERGSLTSLLCGEYGFVYCMEHVFQFGFRSSRLFRNRFFIWDFLEKVQTYFISLLHDDERHELDQRRRMAVTSFCRVVSCINRASQTVGKDGRFQQFICLGVRDHLLQRWLLVLCDTPVTVSMYEDRSFMRDPTLITFLIQILDSLKEFNIVLEASLIKGIDV